MSIAHQDVTALLLDPTCRQQAPLRLG